MVLENTKSLAKRSIHPQHVWTHSDQIHGALSSFLTGRVARLLADAIQVNWCPINLRRQGYCSSHTTKQSHITYNKAGAWIPKILAYKAINFIPKIQCRPSSHPIYQSLKTASSGVLHLPEEAQRSSTSSALAGLALHLPIAPFCREKVCQHVTQ